MKTKLLAIIFLTTGFMASAQTENLPKTSAGFPINYNEAAIPAYILPEVLTLYNGQKVTDAKTWLEKRRPELIKSIEEIQFGKMPPPPTDLSFDVFDKETKVLEGTAVRRQVTIYLTKDSTSKMDLLIYLPTNAAGPVPLFFNVSFVANSQTVDDPGVRIGDIWTREGVKIKADQPSRFPKININQFISEGIGFATVYYGDIEPDFKEGLKFGIRSTYLKPEETTPKDDEWGAISAWSWGLSRAMDYFEHDNHIDNSRIALHGVSRLGKTVLWTGAYDTRFKLVIASVSGEGGAAITRRDYGENIKHITDTSRYYYQFAPAYHSYATKVDSLPFDAHSLVALMAPRALLLQTGSTDYWSDPKGEFIGAKEAQAVYALFGETGPGNASMPAAGDMSLVFNKLGYYMHDGGHGTIPSDWPVFITYLKKFL
ncbi:glucuronyl esterase domain-containing protein [Algoriphagus resistens]|uniref:glucuronyl esterase domain-containing protein n=1 Tax=Algoriphagus resistens TaxID=1750590 RepID=UPI000716829C|nr:hypothetical protein [Algoriphagus resistens]